MIEKQNNHWSKGRGLHLQIGLVVSLALVLTAFEWKTYGEKSLVKLGELEADVTEMIVIPITVIPPPPPPKIKNPTFEVVDDEMEIPEIDIEIDTELDPDQVIEDISFDEREEEEKPVEENDVFLFLEDSAEPEGGMKTFYEYVAKNIKYPSQARRSTVEGRVIVQFVVDTDGSLTDLKVLKGIGAGCDEEAVRVLKKAPNWKPGKQRGRAVKQRITIPIFFQLQ
ncbi:energy transducer TonB [Rapidithrix thailandica]|uniref:Energy transducer TonB n=1 Tax=Rapidithrix thailandica TaxID=413964 RepID=A0AAW9RYA1_9BACT